MFDTICWQVAEFHSNILATFHRHVELYCFYVHDHELGSRSGDNTSEKEFYGEKIYHGQATIYRIVYYFCADGKPCCVGILLLWYVIYNKYTICHVSPTCGGDVLFFYDFF